MENVLDTCDHVAHFLFYVIIHFLAIFMQINSQKSRPFSNGLMVLII